MWRGFQGKVKNFVVDMFILRFLLNVQVKYLDMLAWHSNIVVQVRDTNLEVIHLCPRHDIH